MCHHIWDGHYMALLFGEAVISRVSKSCEVSLRSQDEGMMKANYSETKKNSLYSYYNISM